MAIGAVLQIRDEEGRSSLFSGKPPPRNPKRSKNWVLLEEVDGRWRVKSEHSFKPRPAMGQRLMREYK